MTVIYYFVSYYLEFFGFSDFRIYELRIKKENEYNYFFIFAAVHISTVFMRKPIKMMAPPIIPVNHVKAVTCIRVFQVRK